jgi:hypothetical protein
MTRVKGNHAFRSPNRHGLMAMELSGASCAQFAGMQ